MWRFIIINTFSFFILLGAHFLKRRFFQAAALMLITVAALAAVFQKGVDPFAWFYYLSFSLLVFFEGLQFKRWIYAKSSALDGEIHEALKKLETARALLERKTKATNDINRRANEMHYLYDKMKEISKSMDKFEALLVFGEALSGQCRFETVVLALFDEEDEGAQISEAIYCLKYSDFEGLFDKSFILKNKKEFMVALDPFLRKIFKRVFERRTPWADEGVNPSAVYPILMNNKVSGILIVTGVSCVQSGALSVLAGRFISEIERVKLYEKVETLALTDGLTGVAVRRHFLERLKGEIGRSKKFSFNLSFLMIDVDYFKDVNDRYGHLVGDVVLAQTAETIKKNVRELDLVGRYGGEEFGVLLVETDRSGALLVAERIRIAVAETNFKAYDEKLRATLSIGCASLSKDLADAGSLIEAVDGALYEAKHRGRNRVCLASR